MQKNHLQKAALELKFEGGAVGSRKIVFAIALTSPLKEEELSNRRQGTEAPDAISLL